MRVLIFGLGQFGGQIEAARYFSRAGARVVATDLKDGAKLGRALDALRGAPVELRLGGHREEDFLEADLVVVSPAVPRTSRFFRLIEERGKPWTTELNLTVARIRAPIYAVTGSNGKSTTTSLLGRAVEAGGRRTFVGGNIGRPLLNEAEAILPDDRVVLEVSSFQLEDLRAAAAAGAVPPFAPDLALVTNLTPNHLDRHGTFESYVAAKRTIVEGQRPEQAAVLNREDATVLAFREATRARVFTYGFAPDFEGAGSFVRDGWICWRERGGGGCDVRVTPIGVLRLVGRHNVLNALAVAAAGAALGLDAGAVGRALASFEGLRDRLELVRERRGVRYVNDSKATTPEAAAAGIRAFEPGLTLIAGGTDKGMNFAPFARAAAERAGAVYLIGETRSRLRDEIERAAAEAARGPAERTAKPREGGSGGGQAPPDVELTSTLEEAVARAAEGATAGSTVLFSPACASYDMFVSFEERGERFRAAVRALEP